MKIKFTIFYEPKFNSALSKYFISIQLRNGKLKGFRPLQSNKGKSLTLPPPSTFFWNKMFQIGKCFMGTDVFVVFCAFPLICVLWKSSWKQAVYQRHGTLLSQRIRLQAWSPVPLKGCPFSQECMQTGSTLGTVTAPVFIPTEEVFLLRNFRRKRCRRKKE